MTILAIAEEEKVQVLEASGVVSLIAKEVQGRLQATTYGDSFIGGKALRGVEEVVRRMLLLGSWEAVEGGVKLEAGRGGMIEFPSEWGEDVQKLVMETVEDVVEKWDPIPFVVRAPVGATRSEAVRMLEHLHRRGVWVTEGGHVHHFPDAKPQSLDEFYANLHALILSGTPAPTTEFPPDATVVQRKDLEIDVPPGGCRQPAPGHDNTDY